MTSRPIMRKRPLWVIIACVAAGIALGIAAVAGYVWHSWTSDWQPEELADGQTVRFRIQPGTTFSVATDSLTVHGLVRHPAIFRLGAKLTRQDRHLRAGLFELPAGLPPRDLLDLLVSGPTVQIKVTLPEGIDVEQAAQRVADGLSVNKDRFLAVADSVARFQIGGRKLMPGLDAFTAHDSLLNIGTAGKNGRIQRTFHWSEGYLAPDTYHFSEGVSVTEIVSVMIDLQMTRLEAAWRGMAGDVVQLGLSPHDLLTLASIVEADARRDDERPMIAAVYVNRLVRGHKLEADPTVSFILHKKGKRLFYNDLEVDSPYNTYLHKGLPPAPIGTPGLLALEAAAVPDSTCTAFFFVSDGADGHVFSRTAAEHNAAVQQFRRERRAGRR